MLTKHAHEHFDLIIHVDIKLVRMRISPLFDKTIYCLDQESRGPSRCASAYEISKSTGFHVDFGFQNGFLDFKVDFWISKWISGFQSGFLDFKVDFWISSGFWISKWIS